YGPGVRVVVHQNQRLGYRNNGIVKTAVMRVFDGRANSYVNKHPAGQPYLRMPIWTPGVRVHQNTDLGYRKNAFREYMRWMGKSCALNVRERYTLNPDQRRFLNIPGARMPIRTPGAFR
uniref:Vitelline coat lysin n=1 Tax=Tegula pfeifferi TaxID=81901 RepID=VCLY_TEGPF|nr:RecName: Full=Vitelline coat lysin [Omphalius pfeifferi]